MSNNAPGFLRENHAFPESGFSALQYNFGIMTRRFQMFSFLASAEMADGSNGRFIIQAWLVDKIQPLHNFIMDYILAAVMEMAGRMPPKTEWLRWQFHICARQHVCSRLAEDKRAQSVRAWPYLRFSVRTKGIK